MKIIYLFQKSDFIKNFINLSLNQGFNLVATLIYTPLIFKIVGDEGFGVIHLIFSIIMILSTVVYYGYNLNGPKMIADPKDKFSVYIFINEILSLRIFLSLLIIIILIPFLLFHFNYFNKIFIYSLCILLCEALNPIFYLQGINKIFPFSLLNFLSKFLMIIMFFVFINDKDDAHLVNFLYGISILFFYIIYWVNFYVKNNLRFNFHFTNLIIKIKTNFKFFLSTLSEHFTLNSALIIVSFFVTNKELGKFTLSYKVAFLLRLIPIFFLQSALQKAIYLKSENKINYNKFIKKNYYLGLVLTFFTSIITIVLSDLIIQFFSGEKLIYSSSVLKILSIIPFLAMLNFKNYIYLIVNDLKNILNKSTLITLIFMCIYCVVLSSLYGGYGMTVGLVLTELSAFVIFSTLICINKKKVIK